LRDDGLSSTRNQNIPRNGRGFHNGQKPSPSNPAKACWLHFRVDVRMVGEPYLRALRHRSRMLEQLTKTDLWPTSSAT
jgi:hypothetical protein